MKPVKSNSRLIALTVFFLVAGTGLWFAVSHRSPGVPSEKAVVPDPSPAETAPDDVWDSLDEGPPLVRSRVSRIRRGSPGSISGTVVDPDERPLADIKVVIEGPGRDDGRSDSTRSGEAGRFAFTGLGQGAYVISVDEEDSGLTGSPVEVALEEGQGLEEVVLQVSWIEAELQEPAPMLWSVNKGGLSISGRVLDQEDEPVANITVHAVGEFGQGSGRSDGSGNFVIGGLVEGTFAVRTMTDEYTNAGIEGVPAGSGGNVLRLEETSTVAGRVVRGDTGEPITEFEVALLDARPRRPARLVNLPWASQSNEDGALELQGVQARKPLVVAARAKDFAVNFGDVAPILPGEISYPVTIRLSLGARIEGEVVNSKGEPVEGALIYDRTLIGKGYELARTKDNGEFTITGLVEGGIGLVAQHPKYVPENALRIITASGETQRVRITLRGGGTIEGVVRRGGEPVEKVTVRMLSRDFRSLHYGARSGADGTYSVTALPPGEIAITVVSNLGFGGIRPSWNLSAFVEEGQVTVVDITFPDGGCSLEGTVLVDGQPPPEARIVLEVDSAAGVFKGNMRVAPDGTYRFEDLPPGTATLVVYARGPGGPGGYRRQRTTLDLRDGEAILQDFNYP